MEVHYFDLKSLFAAGNYALAEIEVRKRLTPQMIIDSGIQSELERYYELPDGFKLIEKPADSEKYLIIKAWGHGFFSEINHLISNLLLAELTGRTAICWWGENCLFRNSEDTNAISHFFKNLNTKLPTDSFLNGEIFPPKWNSDNIQKENINKSVGQYSRVTAQQLMGRNEAVLVSDFFTPIASIIPWISESSCYYGRTDEEIYDILYKKYITPTDSITQKVENFCSEYMHGNFLAVHMRGTDKIYESQHLESVNASYFDFIDRIILINPGIRILLLTDSTILEQIMESRYPGLIVKTNFQRASQNIGVHYMTSDPVLAGEEVLIEALLATHANYFLGNMESNVSLAVKSLGTWEDGFRFLLGSKNGRGLNEFLHQRQNNDDHVYQPINLGEEPNIAIIKPDGIGDLVLITPILRELRKKYKRANIVLITTNASLNITENCPYIDEQLGGMSVNTPLENITHISNYLKNKYFTFDISIVARWDTDYYNASILAYQLGAKIRLNFSENSTLQKAIYNQGLDILSTHTIASNEIKHETERGGELLKCLGMNILDLQPEVWPTAKDKAAIEKIISTNNIGSEFVIFSLGSTIPLKTLTADEWKKIYALVLSISQYQVVLLGGNECQTLAAQLVSETDAINLVGQTSLIESGLLCRLAKLTICLDSSIKHIGCALGAKMIEISAHSQSLVPSSAYSLQRFGALGGICKTTHPIFMHDSCALGECISDQPHCIKEIDYAKVGEYALQILNGGTQ